MELHLAGQTAIITGGASGIGLATSRAFAEEKCRVAIWDVSSNVEEVARKLAEEFGVAAIGVGRRSVERIAVRSRSLDRRGSRLPNH